MFSSKAMLISLALCAIVRAQAPASRQSAPKTPKKPGALLGAIASRQQIATGRVVWSERSPPHVDSNPKLSRPQEEWFHEARWAGDEFATVFKGDREGVIFRDADGAPLQVDNNVPTLTLFAGGVGYERTAGMDDVTIRRATSRPHPRNLGVAWLRDDDRQKPEFAVSEKQGTTVVRWTLGQESAEYHLNPDKNWNPTLCRYFRGQKCVQENALELRKWGEVWFPSRVVIRRAGSDGKLGLFCEYRVSSAELNAPRQPRRLTPADIGIEPGFTVTALDGKTKGEVMWWDGQKPIAYADYMQMKADGRLKDGPTVLLRTRRALAYNGLIEMDTKSDPVERHPWAARWRDAVEFYGRVNHFTPTQRTQAEAIFKDCLRRGLTYQTSNADKFAALRKRLDAIMRPGPDAKTPASAETELQRIEADRDRLFAPLQDIYDREVLPRLESLLTTEQIAARRVRAEERKARETPSSRQAADAKDGKVVPPPKSRDSPE